MVMENYLVFRQSICLIINLILQNQSHENLHWILIVPRKICHRDRLTAHLFLWHRSRQLFPACPSVRLGHGPSCIVPGVMGSQTQGWTVKPTHAQAPGPYPLCCMVTGEQGTPESHMWETTILPDQPAKHYFINKGTPSQSSGFSSSHAWMRELDYKESWASKNLCFRTVLLEKTLESLLNCKPVNQTSQS